MSDSQSQILEKMLGHADTRLADQLRFIIEIDKLKSILRQTRLVDGSRRENDAEHSWHLAMMALLLRQYADEAVSVGRVVHMLLIHDIVEIDAGDTFLYDDNGKADQEEREQLAAERLFNLLPNDQAARFRKMWDEFEAHKTPDAKFARAMDRLQPFLHNVLTNGNMWAEHGITSKDVLERMSVIGEGSTQLHQLVKDLVELCVDEGFLARS